MRGQTLKIIACGGRNGLALLAQKRPRVAGSLRLHIDPLNETSWLRPWYKCSVVTHFYYVALIFSNFHWYNGFAQSYCRAAPSRNTTLPLEVQSKRSSLEQ